jgi:hypothetical protein
MSRTDDLLRLGAIPHTPRGARELLVGSLGSDPYERIAELRSAGARKAQAEGVAYQMEHERHIVLARIAAEIANARTKENLSEAKLDRMARADPRYEKHIKGTAAAVEERDLAISEYFAIRSELLMDEQAIHHLNALSRLDGTPVAESPVSDWRDEEGHAAQVVQQPQQKESAQQAPVAAPKGQRAAAPSPPRSAPPGQTLVLRRLYEKYEKIVGPELQESIDAVLNSKTPDPKQADECMERLQAVVKNNKKQQTSFA